MFEHILYTRMLGMFSLTIAWPCEYISVSRGRLSGAWTASGGALLFGFAAAILLLKEWSLHSRSLCIGFSNEFMSILFGRFLAER